jgi:hypothetical protein
MPLRMNGFGRAPQLIEFNSVLNSLTRVCTRGSSRPAPRSARHKWTQHSETTISLLFGFKELCLCRAITSQTVSDGAIRRDAGKCR